MDDVPVEVDVQLRRQAFILSKVIDPVEDEDYGVEYVEEGSESPSKKGDSSQDYDETDALEPKNNSSCICCAKLSGKDRKKKIDFDSFADVPIGTYPFSKIVEQWPAKVTAGNFANYCQTTSTTGLSANPYATKASAEDRPL